MRVIDTEDAARFGRTAKPSREALDELRTTLSRLESELCAAFTRCVAREDYIIVSAQSEGEDERKKELVAEDLVWTYFRKTLLASYLREEARRQEEEA